MTDEYISREKTLELLKSLSSRDYRRKKGTIQDAIKMISYAVYTPAADVAPVVYGRWVHLGGDEWCCSACGFVITTEGSWDKPTKKYCEDCGAKIDGGEDR